MVLLTEHADANIRGQFAISIFSMNSLNTVVRERNFLHKRILIDGDFFHDRLMPSAWNVGIVE